MRAVLFCFKGERLIEVNVALFKTFHRTKLKFGKMHSIKK